MKSEFATGVTMIGVGTGVVYRVGHRRHVLSRGPRVRVGPRCRRRSSGRVRGAGDGDRREPPRREGARDGHLQEREIAMLLSTRSKAGPGPGGSHNNVVTSVAFSPDGGLLASGSWDGTV